MELQDEAQALRARITLLEGETAFDGWAVTCGQDAGLVWITNLRVVFANRAAGGCALPISKIDRMHVLSDTRLRLEAWHQHLALDFSSPSHASAFCNLLRQDAGWRAPVETRPGGV